MEIFGCLIFFSSHFLTTAFYRIGSAAFFPQQTCLKKRITPSGAFFQFLESDVMQEVFLEEKVFLVVFAI